MSAFSINTNDWKNRVNGNMIVQTVRAQHSWTSQDDTNGYCEVPVVFDNDFADTNYSVVCSPNDASNVPDDKGFFNGDIHSKTASGFTAVVYSFAPNSGITVGSIVEVNVIAIYDQQADSH
jgi:hypothetical protein